MRLYNTLSRSIEDIKPLADKNLKIYSCGLTVYSQPHIGNWVGYIYWDILVRVLRRGGYNVCHTQNYTDVGHLVSDDDSGEDKMESGAKREGITAWDVAAKYIEIAEHEGYEILKLTRPTNLVRATDYIQQQIDLVKKLEDLGYAYKIANEGIYFDTGKLKDYGKLAKLDIEGLHAGARVPIDGKRHITDFALWKFSPKDKQRDMEWDSPWGMGFPGWHLECSVIARETLGDQIDIHTGGIDHIPVHHTNEIAQTESVTGKQFVSYWLHNNHLKVDGRKMSKSLGNIYTLQNIIDHGYSIEAFKLFVLSKHYRTEGNFTWENLEAAQNLLNEIKAFSDLRFQTAGQGQDIDYAAYESAIANLLEDDLDTVGALRVLHEAMDKVAANGRPGSTTKINDFLKFIERMFGIELLKSNDLSKEQKASLLQRENARKNSDWAASDELRDNLIAQGIGLRDTPHGQIWFRV